MPHTRLSVALLALTAASCATAPAPVDRVVPIERAEASGADDPKGPSAEDRRDALEDAIDAEAEARRALAGAEARLELAELAAQGAEIERGASVRAAERKLVEAQRELEAFDAHTRAVELEEASLDVEAAADRVVVARTDLQGLEEIFAEETEARAKPEILRRARKSLERAERRHALSERKAAHTAEVDLPGQRTERIGAVEAAEAALAQARVDAERGARQTALDLVEARDAIQVARRKLERAARNLERKRAAVEGLGQ